MLDYVTFLTERKFIGPIFPWWKDYEGNTFLCLLVAVDTALIEVIDWTKDKDLTRAQFIKCLKDKGILIFGNLEEFVKWKENLKHLEKQAKKNKIKRVISEERKKQLQEQVRLMRDKQKGSTSKNPL